MKNHTENYEYLENLISAGQISGFIVLLFFIYEQCGQLSSYDFILFLRQNIVIALTNTIRECFHMVMTWLLLHANLI